MAFKLNTSSGMLHVDDHGGDSNAESFDRADAADLYAHENNIDLKFCKTCFPEMAGAEEEEAAAAEAYAASRDHIVIDDEDDDEEG